MSRQRREPSKNPPRYISYPRPVKKTGLDRRDYIVVLYKRTEKIKGLVCSGRNSYIGSSEIHFFVEIKEYCENTIEIIEVIRK